MAAQSHGACRFFDRAHRCAHARPCASTRCCAHAGSCTNAHTRRSGSGVARRDTVSARDASVSNRDTPDFGRDSAVSARDTADRGAEARARRRDFTFTEGETSEGAASRASAKRGEGAQRFTAEGLQ